MRKEKRIFKIIGMTCTHCEERIKQAVRTVPGVLSVEASFPRKSVTVSYNADLLKPGKIQEAIEREGYLVHATGTSQSVQSQVAKTAAQSRDPKSVVLNRVARTAVHPVSQVLPIFLLVVVLYFFMRYTVGFDFLNRIPQIDQTISWIALFTTGLLTSVHCIAMCGGINLSQSVCSGVGSPDATLAGSAFLTRIRGPLSYNLGRVISYTVIGGLVGGLGSVLSISLTVKGLIMLAAAVFMVLMGLSMLGWLPHYLVPRLPASWTIQAAGARAGKGPFVVGLLNGLIPCGPLQAMQIYALSTGSVLYGAFAMFLFAIGTVPLMLGAGAIFALLKGRFSRVISRVSAVLVILIAIVMVTNAAGFFGWSFSASGTASALPTSGSTTRSTALNGSASGAPATESALKDGYYAATVMDGYQIVTVDLKASKYPSIKVQKDLPVKFNLRAEKKMLTGCNNAIVIPRFKLEQKLQPGDNIISFTPDKAGTIPYTCWMGMIPGKILVVDNLDS